MSAGTPDDEAGGMAGGLPYPLDNAACVTYFTAKLINPLVNNKP
jgi:hypothetical protein